MPPRRKRTHKSDVAVRTVVGLGVPVRKLIRILAAFHDQGDELPMATRSMSRQGMDELFASVAETHTVQLTNGDRFELEFANPHKLLQLVLNENQSVRDVFRKAAAKRTPAQSSPWRCLYGLDECYSGNPLHESGRKILVISWSFREFGRRVLTSSAAWFATCVVRSTTASLMPG